MLHRDVLCGLAGAIVRRPGPVTEADPAALLIRTLVSFGAVVGRGPHATVEGDRHGLNEFAVVVGETAKARKDTARGRVHQGFAVIDPAWATDCQASGLSSREGLVHAVRDPIVKQEPVKEKRRPTGAYQEVVVDPGVEDKRLLVNESEFARVLKVVGREGSTLSAILRDAWDGRDLRVMTRNSPLHATAPHISVLANITRDDLRRYLTETDVTNGFLNRFVVVCARRSKLLPEGGGPVDVGAVLAHLAKVLAWAQDQPRRFARDGAARRLWARVYPTLSAGAGGLYGAATNRAEAHVLRLSCIDAALDMSEIVREPHLRASLALWRYCADSARYVFGDAVGDPVADRVLDALANTPEGLPRTEIHNLFGRNLPVGRIDAALALLLSADPVVRERIPGEHDRVVEVWRLIPNMGDEINEFDEFGEDDAAPDSCNSSNSYPGDHSRTDEEASGERVVFDL